MAHDQEASVARIGIAALATLPRVTGGVVRGVAGNVRDAATLGVRLAAAVLATPSEIAAARRELATANDLLRDGLRTAERLGDRLDAAVARLDEAEVHVERLAPLAEQGMGQLTALNDEIGRMSRWFGED